MNVRSVKGSYRAGEIRIEAGWPVYGPQPDSIVAIFASRREAREHARALNERERFRQQVA